MPNSNIYINSDFVENYDIFLHDTNGEIVFNRMSEGGMSRRNILDFLDRNYKRSFTPMEVIPHGVVKDLYDKYNPNKNDNFKNINVISDFKFFIIYTDEKKHRGDGKIIVSIEEAMDIYPEHYASLYLNDRTNYCSTSSRKLFIGDLCLEMDYISMNDIWRSNCGNVSIILKESYKNDIQVKDTPIFAIDYINVLDKNYCENRVIRKFVIDYNCSPGIPETVFIKGHTCEYYFNDIYSPEDIATKIEKRMKNIIF